MGITYPTLIGAGRFPIERINPWAVNYYIEESDPAVEVKAAPTRTNSALYITHVSMGEYTTDALGNVKLTLQDEDANVLYGPIQLQLLGDSIFQKDWKNPLKLADNKALHVLGNVVAEKFWIYVEGFTGDKPLG